MAFSDTVSAGRYINWTVGVNTGIRGGIPARETIHATLAAGSTHTEINAALTAAGANEVVLLGAGNFTVTGTIVIPTNKVLRGSGRGVTRIIFDFTGTGIQMSGSAAVASPLDITAGYVKGSTVLSVADASTISSGDFIAVYQDNETWVYNPSPGANKIYGTYRVEAKVGNDLTIWPPLVYGSTGFDPKLARKTAAQRQNAGLESLSIVPSETNAYPIYIAAAYQCWVRDVLAEQIEDNGIFLSHSLGCEIVKFDVHDCTSTTDGYGIRLDAFDKGNTAHAIYDCYFAHCRKGVMTSGQQGCFLGYIATFHEGDRSLLADQVAGMNASHGAEGMMTLWEGCCTNRFEADKIHGGAAYQTAFRSRFTGVSPFKPLRRIATVAPFEGSYYWNFVGCVLGDAWAETVSASIVYEWTPATFAAKDATDNGGIWLLGFSIAGADNPFDADVAGTLVRYGNYDYFNGSIQDYAGAIAVESSLAFASKPDWFGPLEWPPYEVSNPVGESASKTRIPAGYRYIYGVDPGATPLNPARAHGKSVFALGGLSF